MQLVYIVHRIHEALDRGNKVRVVFLDISKAFDKVWHEGLLLKLKRLGIDGALYKWFECYLSGRKRVVLEGTCSSWKEITSGVPQGSVLGPLLFLIYINDIQADISSECFLFADDSCLFQEVSSPVQTAQVLNNDLSTIQSWSDKWLVTMNLSKTKTMVFSLKKDKPVHPVLKLDDKVIEEVCAHHHLGLLFSNNMSWTRHVFNIREKALKKLNLLKGLKFKFSRTTLTTLYKSLVRSNLEYADVVWDGGPQYESDWLASVQTDAGRIITGTMKGTHRESVLQDIGLHKLSDRRKIHQVTLFYKIKNGLVPGYISDLCPIRVGQRSEYTLRSNNDLCVPFASTEKFKKSFLPLTIKFWNTLSEQLRNSSSVDSFRNNLTRDLFYVLPANKLFNLGDRYLKIIIFI
jgi:hypothetical protein